MIRLRRSEERGYADHGWLKARHSFSFSSYHDPAHMHFRHLRVINEDRIAPGGGFPMHSHQDMEIITYIINGALEHQDSMGNGEVLRPGEIQRMSAGSGITHSEFNPSDSNPTHLLQIWILTDSKGIAPSYEQRSYRERSVPNALCLLARKGGSDGVVHVNQDMSLYTALLEAGHDIAYPVDTGRNQWVQLVRGSIEINGEGLSAGDGAAITGETQLTIRGRESAEFLLFDLS